MYKVLRRIKTEKAPGIDEVCGEMLKKYVEEVVIKRLWKMCNLAWEISRV